MGQDFKKLNIFTDLCPCNSGRTIANCCFAEVNTTPPGLKTGYSHPKCYARNLGDCSPTISKEHYISRGLLNIFEGNTFKVLGFPWIDKDKSQKLTKNTLTSNILCQRHNSALSGLDTLAKKFFSFVLARTEDQWALIIRGYEIERWMLKVYCGLLSSGMIKNKGSFLPKILPSNDFLNTLFYRKEIPTGRGLAFVLHRDLESRKGSISIRPLIHDSIGLIGISIQLEFFNIVMSFGYISNSNNETEKSKGIRYHPESVSIQDNFGY